jgi:hypothetical protein
MLPTVSAARHLLHGTSDLIQIILFASMCGMCKILAGLLSNQVSEVLQALAHL